MSDWQTLNSQTSKYQTKDFMARFQMMVNKVMADPEVTQFLNQNAADLTEDIISRSYSRLYEFIQTRDAILSGQKVANDGFVPSLIMANGAIEITYEPTADFLAKEQARRIKNMVTFDAIPQSFRDAKLVEFEPEPRNRGIALAKAASFIIEYTKNPKAFHKAMYLNGPFGTGKTHLMASIANELATHSVQSYLVHFPTFVTEIKEAINSNKTHEMTDKLAKAEILMLDDIGAETMGAWLRDDVLGVILQYRMQELKPTFFSSNYSFDELAVHLKTTKGLVDDEIKAKRIMERIRFLAEEVDVDGPNRRHN